MERYLVVTLPRKKSSKQDDLPVMIKLFAAYPAVVRWQF